MLTELRLNNKSETAKNNTGTGPQIVAVTSGKGGVGKSVFSVNLALALQQMRRKVLLIDADIYLGSVGVMTGVNAEFTIADVVRNGMDIGKVIMPISPGVDLLPACGGALKDLFSMQDVFLQRMADAFAKYEAKYDLIIIDTGAGITADVVSFVLAAERTAVIMTPDPASITDAYSMIKVIRQHNADMPLYLVCNMVDSEEVGEMLYHKMNMMVHKFLNSQLEFGGVLPLDGRVQESVKRQVPCIRQHPNSAWSQALKSIGDKIAETSQDFPRETELMFNRFLRNRSIKVGRKK